MILARRVRALLQDGVVSTATPLTLAGRQGRIVTRVSLTGDVIRRIELPPGAGMPRLGATAIVALAARAPAFAAQAAAHEAALVAMLTDKRDGVRRTLLRLRAVQVGAGTAGAAFAVGLDPAAVLVELRHAALVAAAFAVPAGAARAGLRLWLRRKLTRWGAERG